MSPADAITTVSLSKSARRQVPRKPPPRLAEHTGALPSLLDDHHITVSLVSHLCWMNVPLHSVSGRLVVPLNLEEIYASESPLWTSVAYCSASITAFFCASYSLKGLNLPCLCRIRNALLWWGFGTAAQSMWWIDNDWLSTAFTQWIKDQITRNQNCCISAFSRTHK